MKKIAIGLLAVLLVLGMTGCMSGSKEAEKLPEETGKPNCRAAREADMGAPRVRDKMGDDEITAFREYLEERDNVEDLYFSCVYVAENGQAAILALAHEKNAVDKEPGYITVSHIVLNNYINGKVVQIEGSSMDSFSNSARISFSDGMMWVPVYGGVGFYTVEKDTLKGTVYATEMGKSTVYSVTGKKRTEPEEVKASEVDSMVRTENERAVPIKFYKNTMENRNKYLSDDLEE